MTVTSRAVFLSYASQDTEAAERICEALRAAGVEVWLDKNELRGGDAWDAQIRKRIHDCALFIPLISAHTNARSEGYFRREWKQAIRRLQDMADDVAFLVPVVIDETREVEARVPEEFLSAQWTWLPGGETPPAFAERVRQLLGLDPAPTATAKLAAVGVSERSARSPGSVRPRGLPLVRRLAFPLIALLLVLVGGAFWYYQSASHAPAVQPVSATAPSVMAAAPNGKSIAVLPFVDMSAQKDQEYMADGIAEELLNLLAQVPDLMVIARTSSFAFKGQNLEIAEIAKRLNVSHVLEGSVRTSGDKIRVTAQLVRASDSMHLWSEKYDRPLDDIFSIQDDIAVAIAQALQIKLAGGTLDRREGGTDNLEAYESYLRAVNAQNQFTTSSLKSAEEHAKRAIELDPRFGRAWSRLALIERDMIVNGSLATTEGLILVRQHAEHALTLSPNIAEPHALLHQMAVVSYDWPEAEIEIQKALAIDPTDTESLMVAGIFASFLRRYDEANQKMLSALNRDPLNSLNLMTYTDNLYRMGRLQEAEGLLRSLIQRQPTVSWARVGLAKYLLAQGKVDEALAAARQEPDEGSRLVYLPIVLQAAGRQSEADAALKAQIEFWGSECAACIARTYAYRGEDELAFQWLERAYQQRDTSLLNIVDEPLWGDLADDPRFKEFLRTKLKFPERS